MATLLGAALSASATAEFTTQNFVTFQRGEVPVILTAPHGGSGAPPGVADRTHPEANKSSDTMTLELTRDVATHLEGLLGGRPFVVLAEFHRQFIDANRADTSVPGNAASLAANLSYNDADARVVYQAYHARIREFIDEIHADFGVDGVLLDIHGQNRFPTTIYRGTNDGASACGLGAAGLAGPASILGRLAAAGYDVFPPVGAPLGDPSESTGGLNGGHTVEFYGTCFGGSEPGDIDAIQLENGLHLRHSPGSANYARALANAIADFYAAFVDPSQVLGPPLAVPRADDLPGLTLSRTGRLGEAIAVGDFNGDGLADVAAGRPEGSGAVRVYYGHRHGLTSVGSEDIDQGSIGEDSEDGDRFGAALAAGDFDDDGFADLAIGSPGEDRDAEDDGTVAVLYGSAGGLVEAQAGPAVSFELLAQAHAGASAEEFDGFGATLAAGDFNGNGVVDLAVGVPGEDDEAENDGMVVVFYGGKALGLLRLVSGRPRALAFERLTQDHAGAANENGDRFGAALAAGDFNGNGVTDLAIGLPDEDADALRDGLVIVFYGSTQFGLLRATGGVTHAFSSERLAQNHAGATNEGGDRFGASLAAGDFNGNGVTDLAVGVPGEDDAADDDGLVVVFYGSKGFGLLRSVGGGAQAVAFERLAQGHAGATPEDGDRFGAALAAGDFDGNDVADLAVGLPDEFNRDDDDGLVIAFHGSTAHGLLRPSGAGSTAVRSRRLSQVTLGMASEAADRFGAALAAGDTNGDGRDELLIAAPGEDVGSLDEAGAVYLRLGGSTGL
jgi:hypothetical protein